MTDSEHLPQETKSLIDLRAKLETTDRGLFELRTSSKMSTRLLQIGGLLILGFFGYTSFFQLPQEVSREIEKQTTGEVQEQLDNLLEQARDDRSEIAKLLAASRAQTEILIPIGTIAAWPSDPPDPGTGWIVCDGRPLPIEDYLELSAILGDRYGDEEVMELEDGSKVAAFRIPDYQGTFLRGLDLSMKRDLEERTVGSFQADQVGAHAHSYDDWYGFSGGKGADIHAGDSSHKSRPGRTATFGGNETRPKNTAVHYLIKAL